MSPVHHKNGPDKRTFERLRLVTSRIKIYIWNSQGDEVIQSGFGFIADFSETGVGVYLAEHMPVGSNLRLALEAADGVTYRGLVAWCSRHSLEQKFLGHGALNYRAGVRLLFGSEAERQRYLKYCQELKAKALQIAPGMIF